MGNFSTSLRGLLGGLLELMYAKCLKQIQALSKCSTDATYYYCYYLSVCLGLAFYTFSKHLSHFILCQQRSLSAFSVPDCCQVGLRNDEKDSGYLPMTRFGETPLPCMPQGKRQKLAGGRPVEGLQGCSGEQPLQAGWVGGDSIYICLH